MPLWRSALHAWPIHLWTPWCGFLNIHQHTFLTVAHVTTTGIVLFARRPVMIRYWEKNRCQRKLWCPLLPLYITDVGDNLSELIWVGRRHSPSLVAREGSSPQRGKPSRKLKTPLTPRTPGAFVTRTGQNKSKTCTYRMIYSNMYSRELQHEKRSVSSLSVWHIDPPSKKTFRDVVSKSSKLSHRF